MLVFKIAALAVIAAILSVLLKKYRPELAMQIGIAAGLLILFAVIGEITGILEMISALAERFGLDSSYFSVIFKVIGITYIAQFAAQTCRDAGEGAIADKVELAARILILTLTLPIVTELLEMVGGLLGQG